MAGSGRVVTSVRADVGGPAITQLAAIVGTLRPYFSNQGKSIRFSLSTKTLDSNRTAVLSCLEGCDRLLIGDSDLAHLPPPQRERLHLKATVTTGNKEMTRTVSCRIPGVFWLSISIAWTGEVWLRSAMQ